MANLIQLTALWHDKASGKISNNSGLEIRVNQHPQEVQKGDLLLYVGPAIIGRLWKSDKKDKQGHSFYSGYFFDARVLVFRNDKNGNEKAPDYRVMITEKEREAAAPVPAPAENDNDLPF